MAKIFVVRRKHLGVAVALAAAILVTAVFFLNNRAEQASAGAETAPRVIHLVTGEFESRTADGRMIEAYRWDPGTIIIRKGETVQLQISGISGGNHPFVIEGLGIKGEVRKGETTSVTVKPEASGTYPILCLTHVGSEQGGPMVGYIVVP